MQRTFPKIIKIYATIPVALGNQYQQRNNIQYDEKPNDEIIFFLSKWPKETFVYYKDRPDIFLYFLYCFPLPNFLNSGNVERSSGQNYSLFVFTVDSAV